jgi:hypothetical protein
MSVYSNQLQQKHPPMLPASPSRRRGMALAVGVLLLPPELSATPMTFSNLPSEGIDLVFPWQMLCVFSPAELQQKLCVP